MSKSKAEAGEQAIQAEDEAAWPRPAYAWYVLFLLILAYAIATLDRVVIGLLVDSIQRDLGLSDTGISLLIGLAFALFYTAFGLPIGMLVDRRRRVSIMAWGLAAFSAATAACGLATNFVSLFIARLFVGAGEATVTPTTSSLIADYFRPDRRAKAFGIYMLGGTLGTSLAYLIGASTIKLAGWLHGQSGVLAQVRDWQLVFMLAGGAGLILSAVFALTVKEPKRRETASPKAVAPLRGQIVRELFANLAEKKYAYLAIIGGAVMCVFLISAQLSWYPTLFVRVHGMSPAEVGGMLAMVGVPSGAISALSSAFVMAWMTKRGRLDAPLIMMAAQTVIWGGLGLAKSLAPDVTTSVVFHVITSLSANWALPAAFFGLTLITHNQLRGQMTALYTLIYGLIAVTLGPLAVGLLSDYVFTDPAGISRSLATVYACGAALGAIFLAIGWKQFVAVAARLKSEADAAAATKA